MSKEKVVISVDGSAARKLFEALSKCEGNIPCLREIKGIKG